ncbi:hypothetical protein DH2020_018677 [Rehmannia glutinosa]|uniref:Exo_endo_phos domain-containing protein n=1 Tax=Rehmannia glutinosa TaxID=99300 RepID=A0ABR0WP29_REHGL
MQTQPTPGMNRAQQTLRKDPKGLILWMLHVPTLQRRRLRDAVPNSMSCFSWNCRGLGNPQTVQVLKRDIHKKIPLLSGDVSSSEHWRLTCVYGWPEENQKTNTWELIRSLYAYDDHPWLCLGDFNEILYHSEKIGGRRKDDKKLLALRNASECNLDDLGYDGYQFTWTSGQPKMLISKKGSTESGQLLITGGGMSENKLSHCEILVGTKKEMKGEFTGFLAKTMRVKRKEDRVLETLRR